MAYFLFVDESGDQKEPSPCEVLAGVSVEDRDIWNLIEAMNAAEEQAFGVRYGRVKGEIKAKRFLKKKVFRHAAQLPAFEPAERRRLAERCLLAGDSPTRESITALAQAKLAFVSDVFTLCARYRCNAFASIVTRGAPRPVVPVLRKDYAFLFERFFYFLEDRDSQAQGVIVFDELEKSRSNILINQMEKYFLDTRTGRMRSRQIIPQPFFVHSDLTTLIQVADLLAYTISWGWRMPRVFEAAKRPELEPFATQLNPLRYRTTREKMGNPDFLIWSFSVISDLRGWKDQLDAQE